MAEQTLLLEQIEEHPDRPELMVALAARIDEGRLSFCADIFTLHGYSQ